MLKKLAHANKMALLGWTVALYFAASQTTNFINYISNEISPPAKRAAFEKQTGINVRGYERDNEAETLFNFFEALKEQNVDSTSLETIVLESPIFFQKSIVAQAVNVFSSGYGGITYSWTKTIAMNSRIKYNFSHELVHAKIYAHPLKKELLAEWRKTVEEIAGGDCYDGLINHSTNRDMNYDSLGFASKYSRTNLKEDICEFVSKGYFNIVVLEDKSKSIPAVKKKLDVAMKYDLLPEECGALFEFSITADSLKKLNALPDKEYADSVKNKILEESEEFLEEYPNSIFYCKVLNGRALIKAKVWSDKDTVWSEESEIELKKSLLSKYKGAGYGKTLEYLADLYKQMYNKRDTANHYETALNVFNKRRKNFDVTVFDVGANDILTSKGEMGK